MKLPDRSKLPEPLEIYRLNKNGNTNFFELLNLKDNQIRELRSQIKSITITNQLNSHTTNIPEGDKVKLIYIMEIKTFTNILNFDYLRIIDTKIGNYIVFRLIFPDNEELFINYKEPLARIGDGNLYRIIKSFQTDKLINIDLNVLTLDQLYEQFIKIIGEDKILVDNKKDINQVIKNSEEIIKLQKKSNDLKRKMYLAKDMRKQIEYKRQYNSIEEEIKKLKETSE